jgi:signal recognition particle GTPase
MDRNVADISAFESLSGGLSLSSSGLSVFNVLSKADVDKMIKELQVAADKALNARKVAYDLSKKVREVARKAERSDDLTERDLIDRVFLDAIDSAYRAGNTSIF